MYQLSQRNLLRSFSKPLLKSQRTFATPTNQHPTPTHPPKDYDIVIVGGGPVGLALANALATCKTIKSSGTQISVLDSANLDQLSQWTLPNGEWSNRVSSLTNENMRFLKSIGVWQHIDLSRTNPLERMEVWDGLSDARIIFDSSDGCEPNEIINQSNLPHMARFIENLHLQTGMLRNLKLQSNVDLIGSTKVESIQSDPNNLPLIYMNDGKIFRTRLLIGADGFNSPVKSYAKITSTGWNYDAHCVVGTLELEPTSLNHTAWQRFLTSGPLGILPLSDRCASLAWSTKPQIAAGLKSLTPQTLSSVINACFALPHSSIDPILKQIGTHSKETPIDSNLIQAEVDWSESLVRSNQLSSDELPPKVTGVRMESIASFPLRMFHADQYLGDTKDQAEYAGPSRVALVGDAAHVLHPMAGQGLNLGLGDARELAKTVKIALENGQDIGSLTALSPYARSRYINNHLIMATVDKLNKLYSIKASPIVWARSVGVEVLNELPSLKNLMMGRAGGDLNSNRIGIWGTVADVYETIEKVKYLSDGMVRMGLGALSSVFQRDRFRN
ncbi:uncharacterized protein MELLADRAFT_32404 [Melampsora larici-populina 98AG31]|uniref:Ubiquinone biosynthesis monooxygenase COQ6, mitochondrial n=1 Tax=Melampsora larici-populina (strain 98AG31 / pathotype 3-4-7) TaxID=747676 RepID=F4R389_MELLP|nr:uncharacterized protein MELLADRAFT_32404 [Melampsora larici-populina 98AG31]EGG12586.1 hypothetical protein MELLADRAFT_32404 [Melampsora larici-populina 98AG31]